MTLAPLRDFVTTVTRRVEQTADEARLLPDVRKALARLVGRDDWLPDELAQPHPQFYRQYLLHADPLGRFSVVSFVWGPGQATPIHDHTVWGLIGMLRGAEWSQAYARDADGRLQPQGEPLRLEPGQVEAVSPTLGDIHRVSNAFDDRVSVSIHVYGANIGAVQRWVYAEDGSRKAFVSGYSNDWLPKLWTGPAPLPRMSAGAVRAALRERREIALVDVRDEDPYAQSHPLFAVQMSPDRIDADAPWRLPRRDVPVVVYDDGEGRADAAAERLQELGYTAVHRLAGDLAGWRDGVDGEEAGELFRDVNVPSKAFGELVEHEAGTPSLPADEVKALLDAQADVVVLDARRWDEYQTMNIPGGISVPGAELVLRVRELAPDPKTRVIVNCAGRTRSLIGAQSLVNAGIPNPVAALRNGTIGWTLAGHALERGQSRRHPDAMTPASRAAARAAAQSLAERAGAVRLDAAGLAEWLQGANEPGGRTVYLWDVRTPAEYAAGHLAGFGHAPGGQLVQETDVYAAVRGARIVLTDIGGPDVDPDDIGIRSAMTAHWLAQMGWQVAWLTEVAPDAAVATGAWQPSPLQPPVTERLPLPANRYRRPYEGTDNPQAAMQAYLDWEFGLVAQLGRDGTHGFRVLKPA